MVVDYSLPRRRLAALLALFASLPVAAPAQPDGRAGEVVRAVRVQLDNDVLALRGAGVPPDHDYTHGMRVEVAWPVGARRAITLELRQAIFTPRRDAATPIAGERPYAGWLGVSAGAHATSAARTRTLRVELGTTGPASLAEPVQDGVHRVLHNAPQLGWAHQLGAMGGVIGSYEETVELRRGAARDMGQTIAAMRLHWGARAGNVLTRASLGLSGTLGFAGGRAIPWSPGEPAERQPRRLYVGVGLREDVVLRDVLVEGRGNGANGKLRLLVGQADAAVGYRAARWSVEYRHTLRGREYDAGRAHPHGSVTVAVNRLRER